MHIWVKNCRKDGKLTVTYGFSNGVRITKIITSEKLAAERAKGFVVISDAKLDWYIPEVDNGQA